MKSRVLENAFEIDFLFLYNTNTLEGYEALFQVRIRSPNLLSPGCSQAGCGELRKGGMYQLRCEI